MKTRTLLVAALLSLFFANAALAQRMDVTLFGSQLRPGGPTSFVDSDGTFEVSVGNDTGLGLAFAFRLAPAVDLEVATFRFEPDLRVSFEGETATLGNGKVEPVTVMLRRRFRLAESLQPYFGVGVGYLPSTELRLFDEGDRLGIKREIEAIASIGLDYSLGNRLGLVLDARWMPIDLRFEEAEAGDPHLLFDPLIVSAGVRFRF